MPNTTSGEEGHRIRSRLLGSTEWRRQQIGNIASSWQRHLKPAKPMVAVRNLSPAFLEMAIELDVRLADYRDKAGRFQLLLRQCRRQGIDLNARGPAGHRQWVPEIARIDARCQAASDAVVEMINKVGKTKSIRHGDRVLKRRVEELRNDHWWRQLDWFEVLMAHDRKERG